MHESALEKIKLNDGVYLATGPCFETPFEIEHLKF